MAKLLAPGGVLVRCARALRSRVFRPITGFGISARYEIAAKQLYIDLLSLNSYTANTQSN